VRSFADSDLPDADVVAFANTTPLNQNK